MFSVRESIDLISDPACEFYGGIMQKFTMILGMSTLLLCGSVQAEDRALQNALAKAQYMLRQTTAEKQDLARQLSVREEQLEEFKKEAASKLAAKEKSSAQLGSKLALYNEKYSELQTRYLDLLNLLRQQQSDNEALDVALANQKARFEQCRDHNLELYTINSEILGKYENKGFWDVLHASEPMTGLKQVEVENIIQNYRFQNEDQLVDESLVSENALHSEQLFNN